MILTHESGSQEDQFDEKIVAKISWYYPFNFLVYTYKFNWKSYCYYLDFSRRPAGELV